MASVVSVVSQLDPFTTVESRCFVCIVMDKLDGGDLVEGLQRHLKDTAGPFDESGMGWAKPYFIYIYIIIFSELYLSTSNSKL